MPIRIQRLRTKGWRMPTGAVYVGRPTKWGNPFRVGKDCVRLVGPCGLTPVVPKTAHECVDLYFERLLILRARGWANELDPAQLRGKDLVCWCRIGQPCHASVLIDLAN